MTKTLTTCPNCNQCAWWTKGDVIGCSRCGWEGSWKKWEKGEYDKQIAAHKTENEWYICRCGHNTFKIEPVWNDGRLCVWYKCLGCGDMDEFEWH